jgi:ComF family protein
LTAAQGTSDCGRCRNDRYDLARSAGAYEKAIAATIVEMKAQPAVPRSAARMLVGTAGLMGLHSTTLVIPVPLSKRRLAERGFNQAELLGRTVAEGLSLEMDTRTLGRDRHTHTHRAAMDRKAREASVKGAFIVRRPKLISGRDILLVDDVMTSGSTASECARVLKKAGAGEVKVLTLARALFSI